MAPKQAEEPPSAETLKYQTWVLKVLIHCEGCKKKVKKVLQGIEGVYTTEIDSQKHRVTVTGNVEAETLIKKLQRSGKLVELWPEKPEKKDKKSGKSKGADNKEKEEEKNDEQVGDGDQQKGPAVNDAKNGDTKDAAGGGASDKEDSECDEAGGASGSSGAGGEEGGKKKKKKKKNKNKGENGGSANNGGGEESVADAAPATGSPVTVPNLSTVMDPVDYNLPIQHAYPYRPQMYYPPPPPAAPAGPQVYGLSYNTAYPNSGANSYYIPHPMHAYATYSRLPPPPPPSDPIKHYSDDDDEGGCLIM